MSPGDFILTPNWAPHDHGNPSKKPMLWLDVLDMPTVNHFEASFAEHFDEQMQNTIAPGRRFARALRLRRAAGRRRRSHLKRSPVINYTYARTRPILERLKNAGDIDKRHGARVRYVNPITGGWALPTMGAHLALLPKGFKGEPYRSTDGTIFVCAEGSGTDQGRRRSLRMGPQRRLRGAAVDTLQPQRGQGVGAVLDLRPPDAGSARHLARGGVRLSRKAV